MKVQPKDNFQSIQLLRGIAAFLVFLAHTGSNRYFPPNPVLPYLCTNGWMGVEIFFIISGFIIPYSMFRKNYKLSDFGSFFAKRIVRIEPPYIISIAMVIILNYSNTWTSYYHGPPFTVDWWNVLGHIGYINAFTGAPWLNVAYWTLAIEFEYYIIIALIFPLLTSNNKTTIFITYLMLLLAAFLPIKDAHIFVYLPFFLLGILLCLYTVEKISLMEYIVLTIPALGMCYYILGPTLLGLSLIVLPCIHYIKKVPRMFLFLGTISYSLYLTHNVIFSRYLALTARYMGRVYPEVRWISCMFFCIGIAYLYYVIVEKTFISLSKKIKIFHKKKELEVE